MHYCSEGFTGSAQENLGYLHLLPPFSHRAETITTLMTIRHNDLVIHGEWRCEFRTKPNII